jgi:hypothetical protein
VLSFWSTHPITTIFRYITYLPKGQHTPLPPSSGILRTYQKDNTPHYHYFPVYYVFTKRTTPPIITILLRLFMGSSPSRIKPKTIKLSLLFFPSLSIKELTRDQDNLSMWKVSDHVLRTYQKDNTPHYHYFPVYYVFTKRTTPPIITIFRYITYLPKEPTH